MHIPYQTLCLSKLLLNYVANFFSGVLGLSNKCTRQSIFFRGSDSSEMSVWILYLLVYVHCSNGADVDTLEVQYTVHRDPNSNLQFQQTTMFNGHVIFSCSSPTLRNQPRLDWVTQTFTPEELEERNEECKHQQYEHFGWFKNIKETVTAADILQRRCGCIINSSGVFSFDEWGVNGEDFLTFDPQTLKWTALSYLAMPVALAWSFQDIMNRINSNFSLILCKTHNTLLMKRTTWINNTSLRDLDVHIYAKPIPGNTSVYLKCHVTASDLSGVRIQLTKDGVPLDYGVNLTGPLPNGDGTVQMRVQVQVPLRDTEGYQCYVQTSSGPLSVPWDGLSLDNTVVPLPLVDVVVICAMVGLCCFGVVVFIGIKIWKHRARQHQAGGCSTNSRQQLVEQTQEELHQHFASSF
ncbi:major histocompatibility complex class I-related protein 1-like [Alosa pseudoharengus]|uniref:major histocompatibility complex class I-related protein 1-like n=1 Tax=Alosa pseudoharengus TaxID=34774 RepID=UPI003F886E13